MKLVVDMNLSVDWVPALESVGIKAVHWVTVGPPDAGDETIMAWAHANGAVVLTRDLDFAAILLRQGLASPSIVQLRIDQVRSERHLTHVAGALARHRRDLEEGAIMTLHHDRVRIRALDPAADP